MSSRRHRAKLGVGAIVFVFLFSLVNQLTAAGKIRVGAWNLETLGSPQSRDYRKQRDGHGFRVRRNPADLSHQLERLNMDVLALAEIDDTTLGDDNRNNDVLDRVFQLLNLTTKNDWTYVLFPKYSHYADTQLTGLSWNRAKVNQSGDWYRVELGARTSRYYEWDRHPHAMKFTRGEGRTDFIVIPIHMKAGRSEKAIDQHRVDATALTARLGHIGDHFDDKDVILIGDFNMTHASEPAGEVFKRAGLFDLNASNRATHLSNLPLDRVYVARNRTFEDVQQISIAAPAPSQAMSFRRQYSDHWPIVLGFDERADDD